MKTLFVFLMTISAAPIFSQSIELTEISAAETSGGIDVNVKAVSFNGAGYLSHSYVITGNTVDLSVCYWFNATLPVLTFDNDFYIPAAAGNYTVNVTAVNSASVDVCDNFSTGNTLTTTVLSVADHGKAERPLVMYQNPDTGLVNISAPADEVTVSDLSGKLLKRITNVSGNFDLSELQSGVYLISIFSEGNKHTQKLILKN